MSTAGDDSGGGKTIRPCPACGLRTTLGRFCIQCGKDLESAAMAATMGAASPDTQRDAGGGDPQNTAPEMRPAPWDDAFSVDKRIGMIVGERFRVERVIGQGGFGTVYRGSHVKLNEPVAIKFLHAELATQAELRARFQREAKALARLRHPGIVALHDFGEQDGTLYLVMEFVAGVTLQKVLLVDGKTMPLARVGRIFDQVLQVLEAAHAAGVVHRDMKPENVLLLDAGDRSEHVKVLDFGIALMDDREGQARLTSTGMVQGTPIYMSPEQCRGRDVGPRADVYASGVMLFEALAGDTPFLGESATDLMVKHMFIDPPSIAERAAGRGIATEATPAIEAVVRRALSKKADERPSAAEMRDLLARAFAGNDSVTFALDSQAQRIAAVNLPREERGLPSLSTPTPRDQVAPRGEFAVAAEGPRVVLWALDPRRADELTSALAVHGIKASGFRGAGLPPTDLDGKPVRALVLMGDAGAASRTTALRADARTAKVPVLVVDLDRAEETPALIRAGASDVTLALVGDDAICKKLKRLVQRGR